MKNNIYIARIHIFITSPFCRVKVSLPVLDLLQVCVCMWNVWESYYWTFWSNNVLSNFLDPVIMLNVAFEDFLLQITQIHDFSVYHVILFNPIALRMAKPPLSFGYLECNSVKLGNISPIFSQPVIMGPSTRMKPFSTVAANLGFVTCALSYPRLQLAVHFLLLCRVFYCTFKSISPILCWPVTDGQKKKRPCSKPLSIP